MTETVRLLACLALLVAGSAQAEPRLAQSWVAMAQSCMVYAETGLRAQAFGGWHVAADGGGVCNGDPVCEDDDMTFIASGALGTGAVIVTVGAADRMVSAASGDTVVRDFPAHMSCVSAAGTRHTTSVVLPLHAGFVTRAVERGRLVEAGVFAGPEAGPYLGCGHDGRPYQVEFSLRDGGAAVLRLYYPAREGGAEGLAPACDGLVG